MAPTFDKATMTTLVAERTTLFEHNITVGWYTMLYLVVALIAVVVIAMWKRGDKRNGNTVPESAILFALGVVFIWALWRVDTYFEQKQFERAPQTYVIKHLR